ncbi:MAG: tetratricopeptide repeat protein [Gammaproteobacteria bacterium]|nr:MAG: tetratricopeptide repeat protein [Gammaproteobacteria bacterium]
MKPVLLLLLLVLSGCAALPGQSPVAATGSRDAGCAALSPEEVLVINLSQEMAGEGRLHAALANLQRLPDNYPEVRWQKARILRLLNDDQAVALYTGLLDSCMVANGHHGLGQLDFAAEEYHRALDHFRKAAQLSPTNDAIRNDLGLAYMSLRRVDEARFELLTALELNQGNTQPVDNLLTLLFYQNMWSEAGSLAESKNVSVERLRQAEQRAREMRAEDDQVTR